MAAGGRLLPLEGSARLRSASPPRDGAVEVTDDRRTVTLPVREAVPLLARATARSDLSPSARVLADATVLGLRLVAAGRVRPAAGPAGPHWAVADLAAEEEAAVAGIVGTATEAGLDEAETRTTVRGLLDAVADVLPRAAPTAPDARDAPAFAAALGRRLDAARRPDAAGARAQLVSLSLRVEADEDELVAGSVRLVLQVHDEQDPLHLVDAAVLWTGAPEEHGFGDRARIARHHRAACRCRRVAGARPTPRPRRARPDHPRHRRAGQPARRRASRRCGAGRSTCSGRAVSGGT